MAFFNDSEQPPFLSPTQYGNVSFRARPLLSHKYSPSYIVCMKLLGYQIGSRFHGQQKYLRTDNSAIILLPLVRE
jgi:hypothetical protein